MSDHIPAPTVKTLIRVGNFTLEVYAYRYLTKAECNWAIAKYKSQRHIKKLPTCGTESMITIIGSDPLDSL